MEREVNCTNKLTATTALPGNVKSEICLRHGNMQVLYLVKEDEKVEKRW